MSKVPIRANAAAIIGWVLESTFFFAAGFLVTDVHRGADAPTLVVQSTACAYGRAFFSLFPTSHLKQVDVASGDSSARNLGRSENDRRCQCAAKTLYLDFEGPPARIARKDASDIEC